MSTSPKDLITGSTRVSSLPEIFVMIHEVVNDPYSSFSDVARVISSDTALSARLLKIVNSAFYSFPSTIETITHAVSIIGTEQLYDLALATTILTSFSGISDDILNMNAFWRHNLAVGVIARTLATHRREANSERFYLAGIIHDVGRLIILENLPDQSRTIMERFEENKKPLVDIEREVLGFDHADVGATLAKSWKLPASLEETIACHHRPSQAQRFPVAAGLVHLADLIAKAMELGSSGDQFVGVLDEYVLDILQISEAQLPSIWNHTESQYRDTVEIVLSR